MSDRRLAWVELLILMVDGREQELSVRGVIRSHRSDRERGNAVGWVVGGGVTPPVFTGSGSGPGDAGPLRVWREGAKVRVEATDSTPTLITDGTTSWRFDDTHDAPVASTQAPVRFGGAGTHLLTRRGANEFAGDDFTRPTGPVGSTVFLGRPAWTVELAPPPGKPSPMQLVVDAETGLVLQQRNDAAGAVDEWVELVVGEPLDPSLFTWSGAVRSAQEEQRRGLEEHERQRARGLDWFAANVSSEPLQIEVLLDLDVTWLHEHDADTGAFHASLGDGVGSLARRPLSDEPWDLRWGLPHLRWSTGRWDWAVMTHDVALTSAALAVLQARLGDGPPVDG